MVDLNVNARGAGNIYDANDGKDAVVKRKHTHSLTGADDVKQSDSVYQEDRVPPADNPELEGSNPDASNNARYPGPSSPEEQFAENLLNNIKNLPDEELAQFTDNKGGTMSQGQVRNILVFAWNHPGVPVDPQVRDLLNKLADKSQKDTQNQLQLPSKWQPPSPNTKVANQQLADEYNDTFETIVRELATNDGDANALEFAHYFPEEQSNLSPELQGLLEAAETAAQQEVQQGNGFPENWEIPADSKAFNSKLSSLYDNSFGEKLADQQGLSKEEKAALKLLHHDPEAQVSNKENLLPTLKQLNNAAQQEVSNKYNLPGNFKMNASPAHLKMINQEYQKLFENKVNNQTPPLTPDQKAALLGGTPPGNLPPDLKALFNKLKGETINEIADRFGLPREWKPKSQVNAPPKKDKSSAESSSKTGSSEGTEEALEGLGLSNKPISRKGLNTNKVNLELDGTQSRDTGLTAQVFNHYTEYQKALTGWGNKYLFGVDQASMAQCMLIVSNALSTLREGLYNSQIADTNFMKKNAGMQQEVVEQQILEQKQLLADQQKSGPKECIIFKVIKVVVPVPFIADAITDRIKLQVWALDIITGGAISTICQAANMQPIGENPLVMMGIMKPNQAQWMDLALQVVVMVAEIAISCLLAQPELVMGEVTMMTAVIAETTAQAAVRASVEAAAQAAEKVGVQAAKTATKEAVEEAVEQTTKQTAEETIQQGIKITAQEDTQVASDQITSTMTQKALQNSIEKAIKQAIEESLQESMPQGVQASTRRAVDTGIREATDKFAEQLAKKQAKEMCEQFPDNFIKDTSQAGLKETIQNVTDQVPQIVDKALDKLRDVMRLARKEEDKEIRAFVKAAKKAAAKKSMGNIFGHFEKIQLIQDLLTSAIQVTSQGIQAAMLMKQADLALEIARIEADLAELGADLQILKKSMSQMQESLKDAAAWVSDINKQQSQYWKKSQIHFVHAA